jgi:hypothetical protein
VSVGATVFPELSGLRTTVKQGQRTRNRPCSMPWCAVLFVLVEPRFGSVLFSSLPEEFVDYIVVALTVNGVLGENLANSPNARAVP